MFSSIYVDHEVIYNTIVRSEQYVSHSFNYCTFESTHVDVYAALVKKSKNATTNGEEILDVLANHSSQSDKHDVFFF
jgi:hypothetical protein